ncbi:hypothetical protein [Neolewinella antarctica]|uniref:Uncharacterized protein n=1 Tax=Neolewinella antarctica TaxID=442734 RepID=A0ABX0XGT9_9BACT|nr:hypothetical protein [Neolewinella antarctica]NJC28426.1 hypothetical protein [Neolewinella antarctica]
MKLLLLVALLTGGLHAQNIGEDLNRILQLVPAIRAADAESSNPALDETVCLLAYYAGMPDAERVYALASGPALLEHYAGNEAIREFLLQAGIAAELETHLVGNPAEYLEKLLGQERGRFLARKKGSELFGPAGQVDLEQIRQSVVAPTSASFSLASASSAAGARNTSLVPDALVSNALVGLSDFIAKRAQQELTYTFLERLRGYLNDNDLQYLFPETAGYLPGLDLLNYKAILPSIRRAFSADLNAVSFNLGNFLEARDVDGFSNPAVYNIFLVYRILDLELRDVPLPDVLSFTYGELARSRTTVRSEIDLKVAQERGDSPAYQHLQKSFGAYAGAVEQLNAGFVTATERATEDVDLYLDVLLDLDLTADEIDALSTELSVLTGKLLDEELPLAQGALSATTSIVNNNVIRQWLNGEEAYAYYEAYPSLTKFDDLFGPDAPTFDATERRAAGLRAVREILANRDALDAYRLRYETLNEVRIDLHNIKTTFEDAQRRKLYLSEPQTLYRRAVRQRIDTERKNQDHPALRLLSGLIATTPATPEAAYRHLAAIEERLDQWLMTNSPERLPEMAAANLEHRGLSDFPGLTETIATTDLAYGELNAALLAFNAAQTDGKLSDAYENLTAFESIFGVAQQTFFLLAGSDDQLFLGKEAMSVFQTDAAARQLLAGISRERMSKVPSIGQINTTGLVDFLLDFSLFLSDYQSVRDSTEEIGEKGKKPIRQAGVEFITSSLETLLTAPIFQNTAFGLDPDATARTISFAELYPGFAKVPAVNAELKELFSLSQRGDYRYAIDNLLNLFELLEVFPQANRKRDRLESKRLGLATERKKLLQDFTDAEASPTADSVAESSPTDGVILNQKTALTPPTATRLRELDLQLTDVQRRLDRIDPRANRRFQEDLFKYGTFMSDVASANTPVDIQTALSNIALPPGSSQIKRNRSSSFELGAYFGAAVAGERLILPVGETDRSLEEMTTVVSLFVPVGLSYSRQIAGRSSFTLFASVLDLGGITAFRLEQRSGNSAGASVERLPEFSLRNVVAPGLHLLYNFPKTPFSLGFGVQDGPSARKYTPAGGTETREARSVRFMLTGSVDVPIFRFGGG